MQKTSNTALASVTTQEPPDTERSLVLSYLGLRKGIGIIGITLPFVLAVGKILFESPGLLGSISAYYYSVMRDVLVGGLCAIAVFLISYRYRRLDDLAGDLAGVSAIGIALFPGTPDVGATEHQIMIGRIHLVFTACFFLTLAFFTLVLFRKTDSTQRPTHQKLQRNRIYLFSGIVMVACIALMLLDLILPSNPGIQSLDPGFWLESLAIFAFGIAWFIKGETILKDG